MANWKDREIKYDQSYTVVKWLSQDLNTGLTAKLVSSVYFPASPGLWKAPVLSQSAAADYPSRLPSEITCILLITVLFRALLCVFFILLSNQP